MIKVGIAINSWKLQIFSHHLTAAGYVFEQTDGPTPDVILLSVNALSAQDLEKVIRKANAAAYKSKHY